MKKLQLLGIALGFALSTISFAETKTVSASEANNAFGFTLFKTTATRTPKGNKFLSPISAFLALSMAYNGASKETMNEMAKALEVSSLKRSDLNTANRELIKSLTSRGTDFELTIANSLWARSGFAIRPEYVKEVSTNYSAKVANLNFSSPIASTTINGWVSVATRGRIPTIVPSRLSPSDILFLINATYFKAEWTHPFSPLHTRNVPFHVPTKGGVKKVLVPMLQQTSQLKHLNSDLAEVVELPYGKSEDLSMVVALPNEGISVSDLEGALSPQIWEDLTKSLETAKPEMGSIQMPKLEFSYEDKLNNTLKTMGMPRAFTELAEFADLSKQSLRISSVLQKTFLAVNEQGTEAAAATSVGAVATSIVMPKFKMVVDKPYLFAIRDRKTATILFLGSVIEPEGGRLPQVKAKKGQF